jgi:parvulin-like peptidyl-prolyl isomerase
MARRERTTGLPRARAREQPRRKRVNLWSESNIRLAIFGAAAILLVFVIGLAAYLWYDANVRQPNKTILTVGDSTVRLSYYADRLLSFAQQNPTGTVDQALMAKLEEEELTVQLAKQLGISLSDEEVTAHIAEGFGVPAGGKGSSFDRLYRDLLKRERMSDKSYRQLARAELANNRALDHFRQANGDRGEAVNLRLVVVGSEAEASAILARIRGGADMAEIARTESLDLASREQGGLIEGRPVPLLADEALAAMQGRQDGELIGPVQVGASWLVFRVEGRTTDHEYTDEQKSQLALVSLDEALKEQRQRTPPRRNFNAADFQWAREHLD